MKKPALLPFPVMTDKDADITLLPDYPALQQLARALWRNGSVRGASVLVGAGLSKNAERPGDDTPEPPLWWELINDMIERLYPHDKSAAPNNPLRIAEEYRTYFGQAGLDDFIRSHFPDRSWSPGPLHAQLLELPWIDVLTTNWDTLLERASENTVEYSYEIVRTEADLTYARSPRIVKLHGTIGDAGPLIFAEEDYRTYPAKYAAFVNLARQVFIESELCLIGFSGDDPNFLQWAGWVRDHLGGSARRIYLVGNLRLERASRKYLEMHNIAPIDFAPLVKELPRKSQHHEAIRIFLDQLRSARPTPDQEWRQTPVDQFPLSRAGDVYQRLHKDDLLAAELLEKTIPFLKADLENYPGWLVCPIKYRLWRLQGAGENWLLRKSVLDLLKPKVRAEVVFEILWRRKIGFLALEEQLVSAMVEIVEARSPEIEPTLRLEFAIALMRHARVSCNDVDLERWASVIEAEAATDAPARQEAQYQLCLRARDRMDLSAVGTGLSHITSDAPIWWLRCAALLTETGDYGKAAKLIKDAAAELERRHKLDRNSLSIKSQLAWANWINRASEAGNLASRSDLPRPRDFRTLDIDPLGEIEYIENTAREIEGKRRQDEAAIQPAFDAGHYREGGKNIRFGRDPGLDLLYEFDQLTEVVGLPIRINHVNVCATAALAAAQVAYQPTVEWYVGLFRALHTHLDAPFQRYFGRVAIARIAADVSLALISTVEIAISFWTNRFKDAHAADLRDDHGHARDMLRLMLLALSRLSVRMSKEHASRIFHYVVNLVKEPFIVRGWLIEALGELAKYAAGAIPVTEQGALALSVVEFPLAPEKGTPDHFWPRLVTAIWNSTPLRDSADTRWDDRIRQLIGAAGKGQAARKDACLRLAYLAIRHTLKPEEAAKFGHALWADLDAHENSLPLNTDLQSSAFAQLPADAGIDLQSRLQARLFGRDLRQIMELPKPVSTDETSMKIEHLASLEGVNQFGLKLPGDVASRMFDEIVVWNLQEIERNDPFASSVVRNFNDGVRRHAGGLLTLVVVPAIGMEERTEQRVRTLLDFIGRTRSWNAFGALPYFVASATAASNEIESALRAGLVGSEYQQVGYTATAIGIWAKLVGDGVLSELPRPLVEQLIATIETRQEVGLHPMLTTAVNLLKGNFLKTDDMLRLMKTLAIILLQFRYEDVEFDSARAVSISLVRAECVKLAIALKDRVADDGTLQAWIDEARSDPLPEVRFSLANA
jgi:hypothetical protein